MAVILFVLIGLVGGGVGGLCLGFLLGGFIAWATDMSCFEGACGFFAGGIGFLGMLIGAPIAAILLARWASRRQKADPVLPRPAQRGEGGTRGEASGG